MAIFTGIASAIGGLLGGTFLSGAVGSFLIKAAVGIGLNLFASAIAGQPEKPTFSIQGQLQAGGDVSRAFILGKTATAGSLVYANTWGAAGKTPNAFFTQVIALADLPTRGLGYVWVNGERCTVLTEEPHAEYGWPVQEYRVGATDFLWVKFYDGTQTTADSFLVNRVGTPDRPYESTRVGVGVSYVVCTARVNETLFTGFPAYKFEVLGSRLYDITKDSTAGGSGSHRFDNPATWGGDGDDLPAVQTHNLILGLHYGSEWFYGLQGVTTLRTPSGIWRSQIAKCRAQVAKPGGGTETQYLAGLEVQVNAPVADAIEAFLSACQGRLIDSGGFYSIRVGAPDAAVFSFSDGDILSTEEQSFSPFFGLADTINGVSATYPEPEEGWNAKAAPSLFRPDLEARDGNRRLLANVKLGAVSRSSQVQRLMKSALEEARRARRHTITLGPSAWVLEPGDVIAWTSQRNGYDAKLMRVDGVIDKASLDVILDLTEVDPSDYNWNPETDYKTPTFGFLGPARPTPQPIVDWFAEPAAINDDAGNARRPAIRLSWDGDVDDVEAVTFNVRLAPSGEVIYRGRTDQVDAGAILISQSLLPATSYEAQGRYIPRGERETTWSGWLPVTTPDIRLTEFDVYLPGLLDEVMEAFEDLTEWIGSDANAFIDQSLRNVLMNIEESVGAYTDRQLIRQEVVSVAEGVSATAMQALLAATGPSSALSQSITALTSQLAAKASSTAVEILQTQVSEQGGIITATSNTVTALQSQVDGVASSVTVRGEASASPGAGWSRYAIQVKTGSSTWSGSVGLYMDVHTNGTRRIMADAAQFVFGDLSSGAPLVNPLVYSGGVWRMNVAHIGTVTAGLIEGGPGGKMVIDITNGRLEIYS